MSVENSSATPLRAVGTLPIQTQNAPENPGRFVFVLENSFRNWQFDFRIHPFLPNLHPVLIFTVHFIAGFNAKGFVKFGHVGSAGRLHGTCLGRMRIGADTHAHRFVAGFNAPYLCKRQEKTLIGC
jgi:hypothetical protein